MCQCMCRALHAHPQGTIVHESLTADAKVSSLTGCVVLCNIASGAHNGRLSTGTNAITLGKELIVSAAARSSPLP